MSRGLDILINLIQREGEQSEADTVFGKDPAAACLRQDGGMMGCLCGLDNTYDFVVFSCDQEVVLLS